MTPELKDDISEDRQSLWLLTVSPAIWAMHFLFSYIGVAVWCGKLADRASTIDPIRIIILLTAIVALAGIGFTARLGWRKHSFGDAEPPHDKDTPEDRHRFLGLATVLLSGLSAIATIYVVIATLFTSNCA
jgi:hypothetical protein